MTNTADLASGRILIGFLYRGALDQWSYAITADIAAQGARCMRFEAHDVDFAKRLVYGEFWNGEGWSRQTARFPDAIRNFEFPDRRDIILDFVPYSLGRRLRKNDQLDLLAKEPTTAAFIPATVDVDETTAIHQLVERWGAAILKPARGRLGQGIVFVRTTPHGFDIEEDGSARSVDTEAGLDYLDKFVASANRDYVLQQFAAGIGPQGRYFNVRVIMQKSADGDWHYCSFPLALLAKPGTVVANREKGATNVGLSAVLRQRHGARASHVLEKLFSAAVAIARVLDDAIDQRADELALDMAIDDRGNPWLHEANWRGGFWFLDEDVGLYRFGGANAVRLANRYRFGGQPVTAAVAEFAAKHLRSVENVAPDPNLGKFRRFGIDIARRADDMPLAVAKALLAQPAVVAIANTASYGAVLAEVGKTIETVREQAPGFRVPPIVASGGYCVHDPTDERTPRQWMLDELVAPGYVDIGDLDVGSSLSPRYLRRIAEEILRDLRQVAPNTFVVDGVHLQIAHREDWPELWRMASLAMGRIVDDRLAARWGFSLPAAYFLSDIDVVRELLHIAAAAQSKPPSLLMIHLPADRQDALLEPLAAQIGTLDIQCLVKLVPQPSGSKPWHASHQALLADSAHKLDEALGGTDAIILCPIINQRDADTYLDLSTFTNNPKSTQNGMTMTASETRSGKVLSALKEFARFDQRQFFRFFVDGRFHKKYRGWRGYEENEAGSVPGMLNAYSVAIDNFDLPNGLTGTYIRNLHTACMANVTTRNKKSTPGELRYLESGINLYRGNSTLASVQELLDQRRGDGNWIFHTPPYQRPAEEFSAADILDLLSKEGRLRYRAWYPNLTEAQQFKLSQATSLADFYEVKHFVQRCYAEQVDKLVAAYNAEAAAACSAQESLIAISRVVRDLELLHPFPDGNGRTFVAVLMNHLLLINGFLPAILWDPNIDAELSVLEFAEEIERGIENTRLLLSDPTAELYGYSISQAAQEETREFLKMSGAFATRLHALIDRLSPPADVAEATGNGLFTHLTPQRLSVATGGVWFNAEPDRLSRLRFESVGIAAASGKDQLLFFRDLKSWRSEGRDVDHEIARAAAGAAAIVVDDSEVAQRAPVPALFVPDVDDALYDAGTWVRNSVDCKAVAVVGTAEQATMFHLLHKCIATQRRTHSSHEINCKTPQVMASLANLRSNDQIELVAVATGARPNVARHRLRAIAPDICVYSAYDNDEGVDAKTFGDILLALAACSDCIRAGGLSIINSSCASFSRLKAELKDKPVGVQTFGIGDEDDGRLLDKRFDAPSGAWFVKASILGATLDYRLHGKDEAHVLQSVGVLLTLENLGCDIALAAAAFSS